AITLTCILSSPVLAGDIPCGSPSPAPAATTLTTSTPSAGEIPTVGAAEQISDATLSALLTVLGSLGL
ncbi:MAG: hypothetical protein M3Y84_01160, partial [Acidobacteriota bacterium]|nr:hypothetical protein [Acidobacteriota bacterium]